MRCWSCAILHMSLFWHFCVCHSGDIYSICMFVTLVTFACTCPSFSKGNSFCCAILLIVTKLCGWSLVYLVHNWCDCPSLCPSWYKCHYLWLLIFPSTDWSSLLWWTSTIKHLLCCRSYQLWTCRWTRTGTRPFSIQPGLRGTPWCIPLDSLVSHIPGRVVYICGSTFVYVPWINSELHYS